MRITPHIQNAMAALAPLRSDRDAIPRRKLPDGTASFLRFLEDNALAPLWFDAVQELGEADPMPADFVRGLKIATVAATIGQARQLSALREVLQCLDNAGVPVLVFKGMALRLTLYAQPQLRPALDIDLLVQPDFRQAAVHALLEYGLRAAPEGASIDHELAFMLRDVALDLHWQLFRAGRPHTRWTEELFEQHTVFDGIPIPNDVHSLYLMLTHPVITNYPLSDLSLIRLVDIRNWMNSRQPEWDSLLAMLAQNGTRTAAWLSLWLVAHLLGHPAPDHVMQELAPGRWRRRYLTRWVLDDWNTRLRNRTTLRRLSYSLPLYDSLFTAVAGTASYLFSRLLAPVRLHRYRQLLATLSVDTEVSPHDSAPR
jgi:hypothetical protein